MDSDARVLWEVPQPHRVLAVTRLVGTMIELDNVTVEFPVYSASSRSLKNRMLRMAVGGRISDRDGHVMITGLRNVTLSIAQGERVGLVGHNGAGKTTLLRVLSGIYEPPLGSVRIQGRPTSLINISLGIDPEATGRENIRLRAAIMGMSREMLAEKFDEIAEFSGLGEFLDMPFRTYSTGMQLRLAFAISTAVTPEILIMDEWLSTGDEAFKEKADRRLKELVEFTKVLVIASHSRALIEKNCTRAIWLENGEVKMDGPAEAVADAYFAVHDEVERPALRVIG